MSNSETQRYFNRELSWMEFNQRVLFRDISREVRCRRRSSGKTFFECHFGDQLVATWQADSHYHAFEGMLCGGVIGTLLDCHCNWAGALQLMQINQLDSPPCTVTAEYKIVMKAPTPMQDPIRLQARVVEASQRKAIVHGELIADDQVTATCEGIFVAVKEGHPAFHRW